MSRQRLSRIRRELFDADPRCSYCRRVLTYGRSCLDHVQPRQHGGGNGRRNLVLTCRGCNHRKGNWLPAEVLEWARRIVAAAQEC